MHKTLAAKLELGLGSARHNHNLSIPDNRGRSTMTLYQAYPAVATHLAHAAVPATERLLSLGVDSVERTLIIQNGKILYDLLVGDRYTLDNGSSLGYRLGRLGDGVPLNLPALGYQFVNTLNGVGRQTTATVLYSDLAVFGKGFLRCEHGSMVYLSSVDAQPRLAF